jgi:hypothetical protein
MHDNLLFSPFYHSVNSTDYVQVLPATRSCLCPYEVQIFSDLNNRKLSSRCNHADGAVRWENSFPCSQPT